MKLVKSFYFALCGIVYCIRQERNFRVHIAAAVSVLLFSMLYGLAPGQYPPLILIIVLVMALEAVNTAVERAVDLESPDRHPLAKAAKDAAAAGVLLSAVGAAAIACLTFSEPDRLLSVAARFRAPGMAVGLIVYILAFVFFIFGLDSKRKK